MAERELIVSPPSVEIQLAPSDIVPGANVVLDVLGSKRRFKLKVIGAIGEQQLLLSAPRKVSQLAQTGLQGRSVNLHIVTPRGVCTASSRLQLASAQPIECWVLDYPEQASLKLQRKTLTTALQLPVGIEHRDHSTHVDIPSMALCTQLSLDEIVLHAPMVLAQPDEDFFITVRLAINGVDQVILVSAVMQRCNQLAADVFEHVFSFKALEDESKVIIAGFVYQQILAEQGYSHG